MATQLEDLAVERRWWWTQWTQWTGQRAISQPAHKLKQWIVLYLCTHYRVFLGLRCIWCICLYMCLYLYLKVRGELYGITHQMVCRAQRPPQALKQPSCVESREFTPSLFLWKPTQICRRTLEQIWAISTFSIIRNFEELPGQSPIDIITQKVSHPRFLDWGLNENDIITPKGRWYGTLQHVKSSF